MTDKIKKVKVELEVLVDVGHWEYCVREDLNNPYHENFVATEKDILEYALLDINPDLPFDEDCSQTFIEPDKIIIKNIELV